jgi:hypothetical protein
MKHVIRREELRGFTIPASGDRPGKVRIRHQGSNEEYELPLSWDAAGISESTWSIPKGAKLGRYEIEMDVAGGGPPGQTQTLVSGGFRVEEFRVPLMRATSSRPPRPWWRPPSFPSTSACNTSRAAAPPGSPSPCARRSRRAPCRPSSSSRTSSSPTAPSPRHHRRTGSDYEYEDEGSDDDADTRAPGRPAQSVHQREDITLDAAGTARVAITKLPRSPVPQTC